MPPDSQYIVPSSPSENERTAASVTAPALEYAPGEMKISNMQ